MNEEDTYQTLAGQVLDPFIEQGKRVVDWSGRVFEGRSQELQGVPAAQRNEEVRPIGTSAVLNGRPVRWAGQNYGWQSDASYTQLEESGQFRFGQITGDRIMTDVGQAVGDIIENIPEPVKQTAVDVAKTGLTAAVDAYSSLPLYQQQNIASGVEFVAGTARAINGYMERFSETTNTSRYITDELFMAGTGKAAQAVKPVAKQAATTAVKKVVKAADDIFPPTSGGGGGLAYAVANSNGSVKLNFNQPRVDVPEVPQVMPLTVTQPERIAKSVEQGIAESPQFAKQVARWEERWETAHSRLDKWLAETEAPPKVIARNIKKSTAEAYGNVSTGMARLEDMFDEYFYKRMASEGKERHHLFPKAESYQFVKRLKQMIDDGVADMDDMVNLFLYAEDAGTVMGNRKANMLLMEKIKEHGPLHRMRETTEGALGLKMEPKTEDLFARLSEATNADELMDMFDEYLQLNIKPSRRAAFEQTMKKEREFLNVMKPTLSETQRRRL
jgi:hypothetical protein